jgi:hypothetical protein
MNTSPRNSYGQRHHTLTTPFRTSTGRCRESLCLYPPHIPDLVVIQARLKGALKIGDVTREIRPGQAFLGYPDADLPAMGDSMRTLKARPGPLHPGEVFQTQPVE